MGYSPWGRKELDATADTYTGGQEDEGPFYREILPQTLGLGLCGRDLGSSLCLSEMGVI